MFVQCSVLLNLGGSALSLVIMFLSPPRLYGPFLAVVHKGVYLSNIGTLDLRTPQFILSIQTLGIPNSECCIIVFCVFVFSQEKMYLIVRQCRSNNIK